MAPPAPEPDPLADLRDQLRATQEAAARLAGGTEVPPQGWASRADGAGSGPGEPTPASPRSSSSSSRSSRRCASSSRPSSSSR